MVNVVDKCLHGGRPVWFPLVTDVLPNGVHWVTSLCCGRKAVSSCEVFHLFLICHFIFYRKKCCIGFKFVLGQCIPEGMDNPWWNPCSVFVIFPSFNKMKITWHLVFVFFNYRLWRVCWCTLWATMYWPLWSSCLYLLSRLPLRPWAPSKEGKALLSRYNKL